MCCRLIFGQWYKLNFKSLEAQHPTWNLNLEWSLIIFQIQLKWIITSIIWITALASAIMTYFEMKDALRFQIKFKVHDKQVQNHLLIARSSSPNLLATCLHDLQKNPTKEKYVQKFKHLICLVLLTTFIIMLADFPTGFDLNSLAYLLGKNLWIRGSVHGYIIIRATVLHSADSDIRVCMRNRGRGSLGYLGFLKNWPPSRSLALL